MISGEPIPVGKQPGDPVICATINGTGSLVMQAERVGTETLLARIVDMVAGAQRSRAPIQKLADTVAGYFVPAVVLIALLTFLIWAVLGPEPRMTYALINAVAVLIIACPCALGLAKGAGNAAVLVHWETSPEVFRETDFFASTAQIINYISTHPQMERVCLATECEMAANLACEFPQVEFVRSCKIFCRHMRQIALEKMLYSQEQGVYKVVVPEETAKAALGAIQRMLSIS